MSASEVEQHCGYGCAERFVYINITADTYEEATTRGAIALVRYFNGHNKQSTIMEMTGLHQPFTISVIIKQVSGINMLPAMV